MGASRSRVESRKSRSTGIATRIERDSLGPLEIPALALYGVGTVRAVRNLSFSGRRLGDYPDFIRALAIVKKAAARANRDARVLDSRRARAIEHACDALIGGAHRDQFPVDMLSGGGSIAINTNLNEVIANLANEDLGRKRGSYRPVDPKAHVNASQSTADVCHSAVRIAILARWPPLLSVLARCVRAYRAKSGELRSVMTISRTCLQDAMPVALGELFGGHSAALARRVAGLEQRVGALAQVNLGGTVIGSGSGAPPIYRRRVIAHLNRIAGLRLKLRDNLYDAAQNIDDLAAVAAELGLLAEVFMKCAQDLRLLASGPNGGFGEIILPAVNEGSSFFPGKINPSVPETMRQCCFQVLGCERAARLALESGELHLNVFESAAALNVLDAMDMFRRCVPVFVGNCLSGIVANKKRCRELVATARFKSRR